MLDTYDLNPVQTLALALSITLETEMLTWERMIDLSGLSGEQAVHLRARQTDALDQLLKHLVENRSL